MKKQWLRLAFIGILGIVLLGGCGAPPPEPSDETYPEPADTPYPGRVPTFTPYDPYPDQ